jgi:hypothetical protein
MVQNLDGKLTDTSYLTQTQASAVSIMLTTIFKAAVTASISICFAQHLWFILRGKPTSLATIEKLFILRTSLFTLGDLRVVWRAPLLFLMALLVWCLGLATIYPPGALIVTSEAHQYTENYNMPVMNPPVPQDFDFLDENTTFPTLGYVSFGYGVNDDDTKVTWAYFQYSYLERLQARTAASIPDPNGAVVGRRRQPRRVVREGYRADPTAMALERLQARTAAGIPDPNGAIAGRRRQPRRVVREGYRADPTAMALERLQARTAAGIPDPNGAIAGRRRQPRRVVREGH